MNPINLLRNAPIAANNLFRSLRRKGLGCIVLPISGPYPERVSRRDPLPPPLNRLLPRPSQLSLEDMREIAKRIGSDPRVQTVVMRFETLQAGSAALYSLRQIFLDLRNKGKRLIAWLPTAETWDYYLASACDEILMPPSGRLSVTGLRIEATFIKDTLALAGVEADLEAIAEYKTSPDTFRRTTMTEPHREMFEALLSSTFDELVAAIAEGRGLDPAQVRGLIDRMPLLPDEAAEAGLIDAALYEDELPAYLQPADGKEHEEPVPPCTWRDASRWLIRPIKRTTGRSIGVVSVEGMIVPGHSRRAPLPLPILPVEAQAGAETIAQALRRAEANKRVAAVVFYVDSPGGSPLASDLIAREVSRLRGSKPVIALMGGQAASGGYYVAAPANRIVARPTTLTGSIGIWGGKFTLGGLYEKLGMNRESLQRGGMASLYSETAPFSSEERAWVRRDMGAFYTMFKAVVAEGRGMADEQVEEVARGRVWTGAQAREIGLVDELGDFETALALAKELAEIGPEEEPSIVQISPPRHELPAPAFPAGGEGIAALLDILQGLARERVWALAPWTIHIHT
jgi:protease-4